LNRPLKILMISHFPKSRTYPRSHVIAKHLVQRGHNVSLMVLSNNRRTGIRETKWDEVRMIETPDLFWGPLRTGWDLWGVLNRINYLRKDHSSYDLIHCFETRPATVFPTLFYRNSHDIPVITDWNDWWGHGGIIDEFRPIWYRKLFGGVETYFEEAFRSRFEGLTVISRALKQRGISLGIPPDHICHLPGGSLPEEFPYRTVEECRSHVGISLSDPVLGYSSVNKHVEMKFCMDVLSIIVEKYPNTKLLITGKPNKSITEMAKSYNLADNLFLTGYVPFEELAWYLGCANFFILPFPEKTYNIGRWPNKIGEYLSVGRPIVSNPTGDVKTLLEDHKVGILAEWIPEDFARKSIELIENPNIVKQYGEEARKLAITKYDWKNLAQVLEDFYFRVLNGTLKRN